MPLEPKLVIAGLLVGAVVGLTGMGGGSLMAPVLILFGLPPSSAIGTDLAYSAITKTVGAWRHHGFGHVNYTLVRWLATGSVPAAVLGVITVKSVKADMGKDAEALIQHILGATLLLVALAFAAKTFHSWAHDDRDINEVHPGPRGKAFAVVMGLVFGYLLGLTSVGSGTFFGMGLIVFYRLRAARVVGTDIVHAAILVWAGAIASALISHTVKLDTVAWLIVGSIPGILIGSHFTGRVPERALRTALAVVLAVSGASLLFIIKPK